MSQTTIEVRQENPEESENMAQYESPNGETVCASYISRNVAESLGEFATLTITDEAEAEASLQKTTTNYGVYETSNGAVTGLYVALDEFEDREAPDTIGLKFSESNEETFEEAQEEIAEDEEEEAEALLADSDESDEEEIEISDEELALTE